MQIIIRRMTFLDLIFNIFFKVRFWFYRNFYRRKLMNFSTTTNKPGWELTFIDDFGQISWSGDGQDGAQWKWGEHWGQFHPDHPEAGYAGEPLLHEMESSAVFLALYSPRVFPDDLRTGKPITINFQKSLLSSQASFSQKYGRFECRCTLPSGKGTWPAFWMWGEQKTGTQENGKFVKYYAEIDCFEFYGRKDGSKAGVQEINFHWKRTPGNWGHCFPWKVKVEKAKNVEKIFHEYAFEWKPDRIEMFTDGVKVFRWSRKDILDEYFNRETTRLWLIINNGIDGEIVTEKDTDYFSSFKVDYIRAYKIEE